MRIKKKKDMNKIGVIIKDKTILELKEDAKKGDIIDLKDITEVDLDYISSLIEENKDKVYQAKLKDYKEKLDLEHEVEINKLKESIEKLTLENESSLKIKESEIKKEYELKIQELNNLIEESKKEKANSLLLKEKEVKEEYLNKINELNSKINELEINSKNELDKVNASKDNEIKELNTQINNLKSLNEKDLNNKELELKEKYFSEINKLNSELVLLKESKEKDILNSKLEVENKYKDEVNALSLKIENIKKENELNNEKLKAELNESKNKEISELKELHVKELNEKIDIINNLQRQKSSMNVKQTGEDLESWCDNEVLSYMQNGLFNCTWTKDNKVVKEEGESKGSKADYIFKIYSSNEHKDNELLASVCLDMKDENPDSKNKKSNSDYYSQLDKNRIKKECEYSVLVSNLEMDHSNIAPIFKVREYENMYVVRPGYLMTFLNMITSLNTKFALLINSKNKEVLELKDKQDLIDEFNQIKNTYLDKPLESLSKDLETISKSNESIKKASGQIDDTINHIKTKYIGDIVDKLSKFDVKIEKLGKKIDKID